MTIIFQGHCMDISCIQLPCNGSLPWVVSSSMIRHSTLLLASKSRNKSSGMYTLILPSQIKNYVFLPLHGRNTKQAGTELCQVQAS